MRMYSHEFVCGARGFRNEPPAQESALPELVYQAARRIWVRMGARAGAAPTPHPRRSNPLP